MAGIRLVASDLDGTLFGPDAELSARTVEVLQRVHQSGIVVVAATGRSHRTALPRLRPAGVVSWAVCSNGAILYDLAEDRVVRHTPVPDEALAALADALSSHLPDVGLSWETPTGFGVDPAFLVVNPDWHVEAPAVGALPAGDPTAPPVTKVLVAHPGLQRGELMDAVAGVAPSSVTVSSSGARFVEITAAGVDKAAALAVLCEELGVDAAEVMAFGDELNDLTMVRWAGRGVAMANAHPDVSVAAVEHAGHAHDDGVADHLEAYLLADRV